MQIQISWLLQKPTDLDLHCLQRQGISGFSRTRRFKVKRQAKNVSQSDVIRTVSIGADRLGKQIWQCLQCLPCLAYSKMDLFKCWEKNDKEVSCEKSAIMSYTNRESPDRNGIYVI